MQLDIIVPRYKEPWDVCKYLFDTIAVQRGFSWDNLRVLMVNDGQDDLLDDGVFDEYPFKVDYLPKPHGGVSDTRNYGLRQSSADYVMFCDADDGFLNNYALHLIFSAMQEGFDYLCANFVEETYSADNTMTIVSHDKDLTFMHGKAYRREWLIEKKLFFDPLMRIHEDGYFNTVAFTTAQHEGKIKYITTPIYLWRWNDNSTVRKDREDFVLKTYTDVMLTRLGTCRQLKKRGYTEDFETAVLITVLNSYYDFQKNSFRTEKNKAYARRAKDAFLKFWNTYKGVFNDATNARIAEVAKFARDTAYKNGFLYEHEDLRTWLKQISANKD